MGTKGSWEGMWRGGCRISESVIRQLVVQCERGLGMVSDYAAGAANPTYAESPTYGGRGSVLKAFVSHYGFGAFDGLAELLADFGFAFFCHNNNLLVELLDGLNKGFRSEEHTSELQSRENL